MTTEKIFSVAKVSKMAIQRRTNEGKLPETRNEIGWRVYDVEALLKDVETFDYPHFHLFAKEIQKVYS